MALQITQLPDAPQRSEPASFREKADAHVAALSQFVDQTNAVAEEIEDNAQSAEDDRVAGQAARAEAELAEHGALAAQSASEGASNAPKWVAGDFDEGDTVWSPRTFYSYRAKSDHTSAIDPSLDGENWQLIGAIQTPELTAIDTALAGTAVATCIYNTALDGDGGAWRDRCQHLSWYNEPLNTATRGARREFPAVAVIVAEVNKVTIYDGDDPSLPMWIVFERTPNGPWRYTDHATTCVSASQGRVLFGKSNAANYGGVTLVDLVSDAIFGYSNGRADKAQGRYRGAIAQRNDSLGWDTSLLNLLADARINDIAMTVLPNALIDPATGLAIPTIAVATDGGVSVIKDDGSIVDITNDWGKSFFVTFDGTDHLICHIGADTGQGLLIRVPIPEADLNVGNGGSYLLAGGNIYNTSHAINLGSDLGGITSMCAIDGGFAVNAKSNGDEYVALYHTNPTDHEKSMVAYMGTTFMTGWMCGDIKGAWLCDTDDMDLVGGELVTNGDFSNGLTGWNDISEGSGSAVVTGAQLVLTNGGSTGDEGIAVQSFNTVIGQTYELLLDVESGNLIAQLGVSNGSNSLFQSANSSNDIAKTFVATSTQTYLTIRAFNPSAVATINAASVRLVVPDRSYNNRGLIVNGLVDVAKTVPGGDIVGFRTHVAGPNDGLVLRAGELSDLGTNWTFETWINRLNSSTWDFLLHASGPSSVHGRGIGWRGADVWSVFGPSGSGSTVSDASAAQALALNEWQYLVFTCDGADTRIYRNGHLVVELTGVATDLTFPDDSYFWSFAGEAETSSGVNVDGREKWNALTRLGHGSKSADQILKSFQEEVGPVRHGLPCTLYGTSDAVTAITHDPITDALHVGTADGRSDIRGLTRFDNTATPVTAAIAASGGLIVEE